MDVWLGVDGCVDVWLGVYGCGYVWMGGWWLCGLCGHVVAWMCGCVDVWWQ